MDFQSLLELLIHAVVVQPLQFCIVPLVNALIKSASHTINNLACLTLKVLEKPDPDLFKPEVLQTNINSQLQRVTSSVKKPQFDLAMLMRSQPLSSYSNGERGESQNMEVSSSTRAAV